jgi:uncharacterized protein (TIGR03067 family)
MRRTVLLLAGVLLAAVALGSDSPKEYGDATKYVGIDGTWQLYEIKFNGERYKRPYQEVTTLRGGTFTGFYSDKYVMLSGSYSLTPDHQPPQLTFTPSNGPFQGQALNFIYQIDSETLKIAYVFGQQNKERPQSFDEGGVDVKTYKRVK